MKRRGLNALAALVAVLASLATASCQSLVNGLTNSVDLTLKFEGAEGELLYFEQIRPGQEYPEPLTPQELQVLLDYYYDLLQKAPMVNSVRVPGSMTARIRADDEVYYKFDTSKLSSDVTLEVSIGRELHKKVQIRKNNTLGNQIVLVY